MRTPASASPIGQRKIQASGKATRGNASASASIATPIPNRIARCEAAGSVRAPIRSRIAGSTVAKESAPNTPPQTGMGETPVYHQFRKRRLTSSKTSQNTALAAAQAMKAPASCSGESPRLQRESPSRASSTPAQQMGKRSRSTASLALEAASAAATTATPHALRNTARPYTKRERRVPRRRPGAPSGPPTSETATPDLLLRIVVRRRGGIARVVRRVGARVARALHVLLAL